MSKRMGRPAPWWFRYCTPSHLAASQEYSANEIADLVSKESGIEVKRDAVYRALSRHVEPDGMKTHPTRPHMQECYWRGKTTWHLALLKLARTPENEDLAS